MSISTYTDTHRQTQICTIHTRKYMHEYIELNCCRIHRRHLCRKMTPPTCVLDMTLNKLGRLGWGCRIHRLLLWREVMPLNECPRYDTKQSDGEVPVMLKLWGTRSTSSLPSLPGPLWSGHAAPDWVLSVRQIELNCVLMLNWIAWNSNFRTLNSVLLLKWIERNRTVLTSKLRTYAKLNCLK